LSSLIALISTHKNPNNKTIQENFANALRLSIIAAMSAAKAARAPIANPMGGVWYNPRKHKKAPIANSVHWVILWFHNVSKRLLIDIDLSLHTDAIVLILVQISQMKFRKRICNIMAGCPHSHT